MNYEEIQKLALKTGFSHTAPLDVSTIDLKQDVRDMCAQGCQQYARRWSCPPGCGTLKELKENISCYSNGILLQTVGKLEDEFDGETMMETEAIHREHFALLLEKLRPSFPDILPIGTGCCMICQTCTYPDAPCRFPEKKISSMEAYGMLVMEVCSSNHLTYYYA